MASQTATFALRIGSLVVLGRLLEPRDFGLVGMVLAVTGVLDLFKDFGLSAAAVQRANITDEQHSTLFWVNMLVGGSLSCLALGIAPIVVRFYHEPRLLAITNVLAAGFIFNAAGVQHGALLQRQMRFTAIAIVEIISLFAAIAVSISMAFRGYGYWAVVAMTIIPPLVYTICVWLVTGWTPGLPRRGVGIVSMLRFGGTLTLNGLVSYLAYNFEKVLLGRFWGPEALGIYGRAYQLANIPTSNLNSAAGGVVFAALSRVQDEPVRLKSYFLKGYSLFLTVTLPITIMCALFADDLILVLLGPKWNGTAAVLRLLAPAILIVALINPLGWLLFSIGMVGRSLKTALVQAPLMISGYVIGLPYGPKGVSLCYSVVMALWLVPHIAWSVHGTVVSLRDIAVVLLRPLFSSLMAAALPLALLSFYGNALPPIIRVALGSSLFAAVYLATLLGMMRQKALYLDLLRGFGKTLASASTDA